MSELLPPRVKNPVRGPGPILQDAPGCCGGFAEDIAPTEDSGDHGSQYIADDLQDKIALLAVRSPASFVREPEGDGRGSGLSEPPKENMLWIRTFEVAEELRSALLEFKKAPDQR